MITRLEEKDDVKKEIRRKTLTNFIKKTIDPDKSNTSDLSPDRPVLPMGFHGIKLRRKSSALKVQVTAVLTKCENTTNNN